MELAPDSPLVQLVGLYIECGVTDPETVERIFVMQQSQRYHDCAMAVLNSLTVDQRDQALAGIKDQVNSL